mgnify:CR=1 FL=1
MTSFNDEQLNNILEEALNDHFQQENSNEAVKGEEVKGEEVKGEEVEDNTEHLETFKNIGDFVNSSIKWIFLSGKGGVGKTTCSSAVGIKCSQKLKDKNKKILIVSTDPAHNLSDSFNQKFNYQPKLVEGFENLYCIAINPVETSVAPALRRILFTLF